MVEQFIQLLPQKVHVPPLLYWPVKKFKLIEKNHLDKQLNIFLAYNP